MTLFETISWAEKQGGPHCISQIRLALLVDLLKEGVYLSHLERDSKCSSELLARIHSKAKELLEAQNRDGLGVGG